MTVEEARGPASSICHGRPLQCDKPCVLLCAVSVTLPGSGREQGRGVNHPKVVGLEFVSPTQEFRTLVGLYFHQHRNMGITFGFK